MRKAVILSAARSPIGKFQGSLKGFTGPQLGSLAVAEAIGRAGLEKTQIDEVIMGCVLQAGLGQNPARQAALGAGLPHKVAALTLNKVCGSGLKAVMLASQAIACGDAEIIVAGGMESMTNAPYLLLRARDGYRIGNGELVDAMVHDGLWCAFDNWHMGETGEVVADLYQVTRQQQDDFACNSHRKAVSAIESGRMADEIFTVNIPQKKGEPVVFKTDEGPRAETSVDSLSRLKPAFRKDGTVTAGNASQLSDGSAAVVVTSEERAAKFGAEPLGVIVAQATSGVEPKLVMMAPVEATRMVVAKAGWSLSEVDLFEFNEAFSSQSVAIPKVLGLDPERINVNGGAVALGHPIGASGARVLTTLLFEMKRRGARRGVASLCLGGGNAVALAVER